MTYILKKYVFFVILGVFLFPFLAFATTWEAKISPPQTQGTKKDKLKTATKMIEKWKKRLSVSNVYGVSFVPKSPTRINIKFGRKIAKQRLKALLESRGKLEIRPIVDNVEAFQAFENLTFTTITSNGTHAVCFRSRVEVDLALRKLIGPDFHFGVFRRSSQLKEKMPWCVTGLGKKELGNEDIEKVETRQSVKGERSLLVKIKTESLDRLAESGELKVKYYALIVDGDIVARTTLTHMRRLPISIVAPAWVHAKTWIRTLHALILFPISIPVVLWEPK